MVYKHINTVSTGILSPQTHTALACVTVNTGAAGAILKIYDGQSAAGVLVAQIDASAIGSYWFGGVRLANGLFYDLSVGTADCTIVFG